MSGITCYSLDTVILPIIAVHGTRMRGTGVFPILIGRQQMLLAHTVPVSAEAILLQIVDELDQLKRQSHVVVIFFRKASIFAQYTLGVVIGTGDLTEQLEFLVGQRVDAFVFCVYVVGLVAIRIVVDRICYVALKVEYLIGFLINVNSNVPRIVAYITIFSICGYRYQTDINMFSLCVIKDCRQSYKP